MNQAYGQSFVKFSNREQTQGFSNPRAVRTPAWPPRDLTSYDTVRHQAWNQDFHQRAPSGNDYVLEEFEAALARNNIQKQKRNFQDYGMPTSVSHQQYVPQFQTPGPFKKPYQPVSRQGDIDRRMPVGQVTLQYDRPRAAVNPASLMVPGVARNVVQPIAPVVNLPVVVRQDFDRNQFAPRSVQFQENRSADVASSSVPAESRKLVQQDVQIASRSGVKVVFTPDKSQKDFGESSISDKMQSKKEPIGAPELCVLTSGVAKAIEWSNKKSKQYSFIFEIFGVLSKVIPLRSQSDPFRFLLVDFGNGNVGIRSIFYPIDRGVPKVEVGSDVRCVGRFVGRVFQCFSVRPAEEGIRRVIPRLQFMSMRSVAKLGE